MLAALAVLALALAPPAGAAADGAWRAELYLSVLFDDVIDEENVGVRAVYELGHRWSVESALAHFAVGDDDFEFWLSDVSARWAFDLDGPTRWVLVAGFGKTFRSLDDLDDSLFLFHLGIGQEIDLGARFYLRPELRARWNETSLSDSIGGDVSVALGWRF